VESAAVAGQSDLSQHIPIALKMKDFPAVFEFLIKSQLA